MPAVVGPGSVVAEMYLWMFGQDLRVEPVTGTSRIVGFLEIFGLQPGIT